MNKSPQTIEIRHDTANDILIARPRWTLATKADVVAWHKNWVDLLTPYVAKKKPDIVVVLDEFRITGEAITLWGEYRADLNKNYFGISYRVNADSKVHITTLTSGMNYNASTAEAPTVEDAIQAILAVRRG